MPQPGDYLTTATGGWFGGAIRWITHSKVNHAAVYIGNGYIVEAEPKGARVGHVSEYPEPVWSNIDLTNPQRYVIVAAAQRFVGTPYNFLDIAAQAVVRLFRWHAPQWALDRVSRTDRLQCAQLVDECYMEAGVHLFPDGRPEGMISPEDLRQAGEAK